MKEKIIKLIAECKFNGLSFKSNFLYHQPFKYTNQETYRYLFWLTELNLWLFLNFDVVITQHMGHLERLEDQIFNVLTDLKDN